MADPNVTVGIDLKLTELVDNLADKLGVATEKLQPLAKEGLDQYIMRETMFTIALFAVALISILGIYFGFHIAKNAPQTENCGDVSGILVFGVAMCVISIIGFGVGLINGLCHLGNALAPLPSLLGL